MGIYAVIIIATLLGVYYNTPYCKELEVKQVLHCTDTEVGEQRCALLFQDENGIESTDFTRPANVGDMVEVCRDYEWRK